MLKDVLTWAEIDLDAIAHDARQLKQRVGEHTELIAVVKANAYGHGAVMVARTVLESGATRLAVNRVPEGVQLRQAGISAPILIVGYSLPGQAPTVVRWGLTPTVISRPVAAALSEAAQEQGKSIPVHVEVDSGMGRFGLLPDEVVGFVRMVSTLPSLRVEGLYTHFAVADAADKTYTRRQFGVYREVTRQLKRAGFSIPLEHVANSATTLDLPDMHLDAVRCGIALYGLRPSDEVEPVTPLRPAMTLKSRVARVRTLPAGSCISYGCTYTTSQPTPVALVPAGYGDGYHRILSNRGAVLIHGRRAPIVGRVCMDQFVVDASDVPGVAEGEEVVLFGRQGEAEISAEEVAVWADTINYEVTTSILPRVTRVYRQGGEVVAVQRLGEE